MAWGLNYFYNNLFLYKVSVCPYTSSMVHTSHSLADTEKMAEMLISYLSSRFLTQQPSVSVVIGLSGDLGSGKTAFTKCVAGSLGVKSPITSPTFVIQKRYPIEKDDFPFKTLVHIDAYRLENARELEMLDFKKDLEDPTVLMMIEWPEKVIEALPPDTIMLRFAFVSEHVRTIEFPGMMGA
jgi:tRNA threonylcarbamoyladenosine biosynthesis protein TsaE